MEPKSHFNKKSVIEHLLEARKKGYFATKEHHSIEAPGHIIGGADAAKETALSALLIYILLQHFLPYSPSTHLFLALFLVGFFLWKIGRSMCLGWTRLERINNLVEDEQHEIKTNIKEERMELTEMYRAKGFSGPLLEKVIDTLMSDDNKLLGIMLEEELGISLESYEHPLKQALGVAVGVFLASCMIWIGLALSPVYGVFLFSYLTILIASFVMSKIERVRLLHSMVWNLSITFLSSFGLYFLLQFFKGES